MFNYFEVLADAEVDLHMALAKGAMETSQRAAINVLHDHRMSNMEKVTAIHQLMTIGDKAATKHVNASLKLR